MRVWALFGWLTVAALGAIAGAGSARAVCTPIASTSPLVHYAAFEKVPLGSIRITYLGHASFEIESPEGTRAVTDFNGYITPQRVPDVVTMNNSHRGHFTDTPDPAIAHVLRGWSMEKVERYNILVRDLRVRNVPTNIEDFGGKTVNGNSIFVFEAAGLCIAHISHVHHRLSEDQVRDLGSIDVAMVAVDGTVTMSLEELFDALGRVRPRLVLPMHFIAMGSAETFAAAAKPRYKVTFSESDTVLVSDRTLPRDTQVMFLRGQ
jgi:L-ascorbate metabolism protein UlaG (beta-lactamase superfamily)